MTDLAHNYGGGLALSASGDLLTASGSSATTQRVLRRLLTNRGDYVWQGDYGVGLGRFVGQPARVKQIEALILRQMLVERGVAPSPPPTVTVVSAPGGVVTATLRYADADTGVTVTDVLPLA